MPVVWLTVGPEPSPPSDDAARRLLDKLRDFSDSLPADERAFLGALLAPGIALAYADSDERDDSADVAGFEMVGWRPTRLPAALARELSDRGVRVVEL
jgi:hypothetical protein